MYHILYFFHIVRLWEANVPNRQSLVEPFVWLTSRITQPQSEYTNYIRCMNVKHPTTCPDDFISNPA
jgi:hypothetical protein